MGRLRRLLGFALWLAAFGAPTVAVTVTVVASLFFTASRCYCCFALALLPGSMINSLDGPAVAVFGMLAGALAAAVVFAPVVFVS